MLDQAAFRRAQALEHAVGEPRVLTGDDDANPAGADQGAQLGDLVVVRERVAARSTSTPSARTRATMVGSSNGQRAGHVQAEALAVQASGQDLELRFLAADADRVHQEQHVDRRPAAAGGEASGAPRRHGRRPLRSRPRRATRSYEVPLKVEARRARQARRAASRAPRSGVSSSRLSDPAIRLMSCGGTSRPVVLVADDLRDAADIAGDDRHAARHGLDDRVGQALGQRRMADDVARGEKRRHVVDVAEQVHALAQAQMIAELRQPLALVALAGQEEPHVGMAFEHARRGEQQVVEALHRRRAAPRW